MSKALERSYIIVDLPKNFVAELDNIFEEEFAISQKKWRTKITSQKVKEDIRVHSFSQLSRKIKEVAYSDFSFDSTGVRVRVVKDHGVSEIEEAHWDSTSSDNKDIEALVSADVDFEYNPSRMTLGAKTPLESSVSGFHGVNLQSPESAVSSAHTDTQGHEKPTVFGTDKECVVYAHAGSVQPPEVKDTNLFFSKTQGFMVVDVPTRDTIKVKDFRSHFINNIKKWIRTATFYGVGSYS